VATDRDDRWSDDDGPGRGDRMDDSPDEIRRRAAAKLATPATLMVASAVFMFVWLGLNLAVLASGYDLSPAILDWMADMQPPGKAKDDLKKQAQDAKTRDRTAEYVQTAVISVINVAFNTLVLLGGLRMKAMRNHTLAMIGSIAAMIPVMNSCCCVGLPVGIWSLITLMNPDVKAAFALNAGGRSASRDQDEGWAESGR
jgi:hypothetical protein